VPEILRQELDVSPVRHTCILVVAHRFKAIIVHGTEFGNELPAITASMGKVFFFCQVLSVADAEEINDAECTDVMKPFGGDDVTDGCGIVPDLTVIDHHQV